MIHVWLDQPKNPFKVWNETTLSWEVVAGLSQLNTASFIKSSDKEVCLYLPTQSVLTLDNDLTQAQLKQLGKSGQQYLFEDLALSAVEQLQVRHLADGPRRYFYALNTTEIEQWQQSLELAGYKLTALLPDFVLLPSPDTALDNEVVLYISSNQQAASHIDTASSSALAPTFETVLARFSTAQGLAVGHLSLLPRLLSNIEEIVLVQQEPKEAGEPAQNMSASQLTPNVLHQIADKAGIVITPSIQRLAPIANANKHPLNFVESKRTPLASPYLAWVAGLLLLAGITQIAADALQWYQYEQAATATKSSMDTQFKTWFSGESLNPRVDVVAQVKPRLAVDAKQQPQLEAMSRIGPLIRQSQLTAESLRWNDSNIIMTVKGADRDAIDRLYRGLTEQGLTASLGTVKSVAADQVIGEITVAINSSHPDSTPP